MSLASKGSPTRLRGRTVRQIESSLIAHRVDRIIGEHVERPAALRRADMLVAALTLKPRDPFGDRQRNG
jgi:hypothetical protein